MEEDTPGSVRLIAFFSHPVGVIDRGETRR